MCVCARVHCVRAHAYARIVCVCGYKSRVLANGAAQDGLPIQLQARSSQRHLPYLISIPGSMRKLVGTRYGIDIGLDMEAENQKRINTATRTTHKYSCPARKGSTRYKRLRTRYARFAYAPPKAGSIPTAQIYDAPAKGQAGSTSISTAAQRQHDCETVLQL